eukprot:g132.t1
MVSAAPAALNGAIAVEEKFPAPGPLPAPFFPGVPYFPIPNLPELKLPEIKLPELKFPDIKMPSMHPLPPLGFSLELSLPGLCDFFPQLCSRRSCPPELPEMPGIPKLWLPDILQVFTTAVFLTSMVMLARSPGNRNAAVKETDMQILTDYQSKEIRRTDLNDAQQFACGRTVRRSMPVVAVVKKDSMFGTSTRQRVVGQHPLIEFLNPHDVIHVKLEDLTESGDVLWDAKYNLRHTNLLTPFAQPVGGSRMDFGTLCPPLHDFPHTFNLEITDETTGEYLGSAVYHAYYTKHDPTIQLPPASGVAGMWQHTTARCLSFASGYPLIPRRGAASFSFAATHFCVKGTPVDNR